MTALLFTVILLPMLCAALVIPVGKRTERGRNAFAVAAAAAEFLLLIGCALAYKDGEVRVAGLCGFGLSFTADGFSMLYALLAGFAWLIASVFSVDYLAAYRNKNRLWFFHLFTLGCVVGMFLSADLLTAFVFFEMMSLASYPWVAHDETKPALKAAETYLAVAVIGGMVCLMGLFLLSHELGTLAFSELRAAAAAADRTVLYIAGGCLLFGFGAKAGMFPLHIWLPKAHPVAPAPQSALLSGVLTKTGVFGVLLLTSRIFAGSEAWGLAVLLLGTVTMALGAVLAVLSVDMKRILACSSVSQIGFILIGAAMLAMPGAEKTAAVFGTVMHMINHTLIKLLLFCLAGVVYRNLHALDLNDIRGFARGQPLFNVLFLVGAAAVAGLPFFSGFVSKSLLHEALLEYGGVYRAVIPWVEGAFVVSGGLTLAYMAKLFTALNAKGDGPQPHGGRYLSRAGAAALSLTAAVLLVFGLLPRQSAEPLLRWAAPFLGEAGEASPAYFAWENFRSALMTIAVGAAVYFGVVRTLLSYKKNGVRVYRSCSLRRIDLETLVYRPLIAALLAVLTAATRLLDSMTDFVSAVLRRSVFRDVRPPFVPPVGTKTTFALGRFADAMARLFRREHAASYTRVFAGWHENISAENKIIGRSFSYGMLCACVGLCATILYLLYCAVR